MLKKIDDYVLDSPFGIQKISETIEYFTYLTHVAQARALAVVGLAVAVTLNWKLIAVGDEAASWWTFGWLNFFLFIMLVHSIMIEKMSSKKGFKNPEREMGRFTRVFILFLSIFQVITEGLPLIEVTRVVIPGFLYLLACQPLPPGDRFFDRVKQTA